jgi:hypothetical protein
VAITKLDVMSPAGRSEWRGLLKDIEGMAEAIRRQMES